MRKKKKKVVKIRKVICKKIKTRASSVTAIDLAEVLCIVAKENEQNCHLEESKNEGTGEEARGQMCKER